MITDQLLQFYSANGTPFYVRKPSTILKGCLANSDVAKEINRYPVLTDGPYRFEFKCMLIQGPSMKLFQVCTIRSIVLQGDIRSS